MKAVAIFVKVVDGVSVRRKKQGGIKISYLIDKFKGIYRIKVPYDLSKNDFNRKLNGTLEDIDCYIDCQNNCKIFHYGRDILQGYIPSLTRGRNIIKVINNINPDLIFNIEEKSTKYVDDMKERINSISEKIKSVKEPMKVLVIEGEGENKYRVYGPKTLVSDMVSKAGGTNVAKESGSVGVENIIEMNPDAIVLIHYLNQNKDNKEEKALLENPALKNVTAIKENKIIYTPLSETYAGGARTVEGIERIAKGLYPDLLK